MSRRSAVVAVGPALAGRFRHARRVLDTSISLVRERELEQAPPDRDYAAPLLRLLSVGRLSAEKNPLALADVLAALRDRDPRWSLVVCGDGPLRRPLEERLERLGLREHADLRGYVAVGDALTEAYRTSHALLNPSWTEGVPQVLYESFAAGLPVVATAVGGVPEAAGGAAALVAPGDLEAATDAVLRVAGDEALRDALVAAGRARASEHTLEAQARRVAGFVRDELTGTARARD
jgi:glycosyltransferase involved in cell wall biosynthesis